MMPGNNPLLSIGRVKLRSVLATAALIAALAGAWSCSGPATNRTANFSAARSAPAKSDPNFILGVGDKVVVAVWRNTDLGGDYTIDPGGNVDLALAGPIKAAGLTPGQLADSIKASLAKYIKEPQVGVAVSSVTSRKLYVLGEVKTPGPYTMLDSFTPWEAIGAAGGFSKDANRHHVLVMRQDDKGEVKTCVVSVVSGRTPDGRPVTLTSRDIVYVPQSGISSVEDFMKRINNIIQPFLSVTSAILLGSDVLNVLYPGSAAAGGGGGGGNSGAPSASIPVGGG